MMKVSCGWEESERGGRRRNEVPAGEEGKWGGTSHWGMPEAASPGPAPQLGSCPAEPYCPTSPAGHHSVSLLV